MVYYVARRYSTAIERSDRALELEPHSPTALYYQGLSQHFLDRGAEALWSLKRAQTESHEHPSTLAALGFVLAQCGKRHEALALLEQMKDRATRAEVSPYDFAEIYVGLADHERAIEYLKRSCALHIPEMVGIGVDPFFAALHQLEEFQRILYVVGVAPR
jgi:tetratricopeptide (TPR) repeat protein